MPLKEKILRNFKLTKEEDAQLERDAHAHNMNVSEYIRWLVEREREESSRTQGLYFYGMRLRGFSPGCQPMEGFAYRLDDPYGSYHDILAYKRKLSDKECEDYDLTYIKENREE